MDGSQRRTQGSARVSRRALLGAIGIGAGLEGLLAACGGTSPAIGTSSATTPSSASTPPGMPAIATTPTATPPAASPTARSTPAATPTSAARGQVVEYQSVRFVVPDPLRLQFTGTVEPEVSGSGLPYFAILPLRLIFAPPGISDTLGPAGPIVAVLPVKAYAAINDFAGHEMARLHDLLTSRPDLQSRFPGYPVSAGNGEQAYIPVLPVVNAAATFQARMTYLTLQDGSAIRFLTVLGQNIAPVDPEHLEYRIQGMTRDGAWCVAAVSPVAARLATTATPPDTVRPAASPEALQRAIDSYNQLLIRELEQLPENRFSPDLAALDQMIASLQVGSGPFATTP